jgi:hypothetical protein
MYYQDKFEMITKTGNVYQVKVDVSQYGGFSCAILGIQIIGDDGLLTRIHPDFREIEEEAYYRNV